MGRASLLLCIGALAALGIVALGTASQGQMLTEKSIEYAQKTKALNTAHTAIQMAMQKINKDETDTWAKNHDSSNPWVTTIDGVKDSLYVDYIYESTNYWEADSLRLVSKSTVITKDGSPNYKGRVVSVYLMAPFSNLVPEFKSALTIATDQVYPFSASGSASISGTAPTGSGCEDKPVMSIVKPDAGGSATDSTKYASELNNITTSGSPKVKVDSELSYQPTDELIARLEDSPDRVNVGTDYKDSLGTASDPGVFFIEDGANLTGSQKSGYGIIVVKAGAQLKYNGELKVAGNFEFNGLIIFENAYDFSGNGTPTINGSVLIGNTEDYSGNIDVNINGDIHMQYDCRAEEYAKKAAAQAVQQNKYTRVVTMEETEFNN